MSDKINGRTPEEVKKGLEHCCYGEDCTGCRYRDLCMEAYDCKPMHEDVLALIRQLERERDAAVEDIGRACATCIHFNPKCHECNAERCFSLSGVNSSWQWRGVQEVE